MSDIFDELVGEEKKEEVKEEKKEITKQTERKAEVQLDELVSEERAKEEEKPIVNVNTNNATTKTEEKGGEIEIEEELTTGKEVFVIYGDKGEGKTTLDEGKPWADSLPGNSQPKPVEGEEIPTEACTQPCVKCRKKGGNLHYVHYNGTDN